MHMTPIAILAIIFAVVQAATITLPVTQDFAIVNQDRVRSVIAKNDKISLFNNGILSSITYFGVDTQSIIRQAEITSTSPVASMIESAQLIFNNITLLSAQVGAINIHVSALNPGQMWTEDTVTLDTTPTIQGSLGSIDFSKEKPSLDVTNHMIQALSNPYQGAMFGFHIGMPGGPLEVASHRVDPNSVVVEVIYSLAVGPGATSPHQSTTTRAPASTSSTNAPSQYCWSCGPGWTHWYNIEGVSQPEDPCACVRDPAASTATPGVPAAPSTSTTRAPSAGTTTTRAPSTPTTSAAPGVPTTSGAPGAPTTSGAPASSSTTEELTTTTGPTVPERQSSAAKSAFSTLVVFVLLALYL